MSDVMVIGNLIQLLKETSVILFFVLLCCMPILVNAQYYPRIQRSNYSSIQDDLFGRRRNTIEKRSSDSNENTKKKKSKKQSKASSHDSLADDEVSLVVSGEGATKDDATKIALRSAIEQAFGTFVSSNTKILNDELVKDEIVTVSSGNIKSYEYLSVNNSSGNYNVVVKAVVSIGKLISYTQAKGGQTELAGETFIMNVKMTELYKKNEEKAIEHLIMKLKELLPNMLDYSISAGTVSRKGERCIIPAIVTICTNNNYKVPRNIIWNTLSALCLKTEAEIRDYENKGFHPIRVYFYAEDGTYTSDIPLKTFEEIWGGEKRLYACFRSDKIRDIAKLFQKSIGSFIIDYGADKSIFTYRHEEGGYSSSSYEHYTGQKGEFMVYGLDNQHETARFYEREAKYIQDLAKYNKGIIRWKPRSTNEIEKEELVNFGHMSMGSYSWAFPVSNSASWHMKGTLYFTDNELEKIKNLKVLPINEFSQR